MSETAGTLTGERHLAERVVSWPLELEESGEFDVDLARVVDQALDESEQPDERSLVRRPHG